MDRIEGSIDLSSCAPLVIAKDVQIQGNITAQNVEVHGHIQGNISASGTVTLFPLAKVEGNISSAQLIVYPGAQLQSSQVLIEKFQEV